MHSTLNSYLGLAQKEGLSFCAWRLPGETEIQHAGPAPEMIWDKSSSDPEIFVFAPFNGKRHPVFMIGREGELSKMKPPSAPANTDKKHFLKWASTAIQAIKSGRFRKIVAARVHERKLAFFDPVKHFLGLCEKQPGAFCSLWFSPSTGLWLGASPELLLERNEKNIRTVALAGTRLIDGEGFGSKEEEEQGLVLEYLEEVLSPWLEDKRVASQTRVTSGHLHHLTNEIRGHLKEARPDMMNLINKLHPTPAVAGLPKEEAIGFIEQEEGMDRTYYSGFLGTLSQDHCRLFANLRCMQVLKDTQFIYAGAGLTADSDPEKEWQETEEKTKVVLLL